MTDAAIMARGTALVDAGEHRRAADGHDAVVEMLGERVFEVQLDTGHFHRGKEFAVRKLREAFRLAANARKFLNIVVPGSDVGIANRPIDGDSVFQVGLKIEIAPAIALAAPGDGLSAHLAPANPGEMLSR